MLGVGFQGVERIVFKKDLNSWIPFSMVYFDLKPWLRSKFEISPELRIPRLGERVTWWSEVHVASSLINKLLCNTKCLSSKGKTTMSKLQVEVLAAKKRYITLSQLRKKDHSRWATFSHWLVSCLSPPVAKSIERVTKPKALISSASTPLPEKTSAILKAWSRGTSRRKGSPHAVHGSLISKSISSGSPSSHSLSLSFRIETKESTFGWLCLHAFAGGSGASASLSLKAWDSEKKTWLVTLCNMMATRK